MFGEAGNRFGKRLCIHRIAVREYFLGDATSPFKRKGLDSKDVVHTALFGSGLNRGP